MKITTNTSTELVEYVPPAGTHTLPASADESSETNKNFAGLVNQGATCYMNSLLQALFMTPEFRSAIYQWRFAVERDGPAADSVPYQLQKLFGQLQAGMRDASAVDTVGLTRAFGWDGAEVYQQQDVQELVRVLFDALEEAFGLTLAGGGDTEAGVCVDADGGGVSSDELDDAQSPRSVLNPNIIDDLYAGELIDYIKCMDVDYASERTDKFLDLSLAIRADSGGAGGEAERLGSLQRCLEYYLTPEILDGDNQYFAGEPHNSKVDAIKGLKFTRLPKILSVQLKRFVYDFSGYDVRQVKLNDRVQFPFILDMNSYISRAGADNGEGGGLGFETFLSEQIQRLRTRGQAARSSGDQNCKGADSTSTHEPVPVVSEQSVPEGGEQYDDCADMTGDELAALVRRRGPWVYELYAVLVHGGVCGGGHYFAFIKDLDASKACGGPNQMHWYRFNDATVSKVDVGTVRQAWGANPDSAPSAAAAGVGASEAPAVGPWPMSSPSWATSLRGSGHQATNNAYLLLYRKVEVGLEAEAGLEPRAHTGSVFPSDVAIPGYISAALREEREAVQRREEELRERQDKLTLTVCHHNTDGPGVDNSDGTRVLKEAKVISSRRATLRDLLLQCYTQLELGRAIGHSDDEWEWESCPEQEEEEEVVVERLVDPAVAAAVVAVEPTAEVGGSGVILLPPVPEPILLRPMCLNYMRLRRLASISKIPGAPVALTEETAGLTLSGLKVHNYDQLYVELRRGLDEPWGEYIEDGINLSMIGYVGDSSVQPTDSTAASGRFQPPRLLRIARASTVAQLKDAVYKWVCEAAEATGAAPFPRERLRLLRILGGSYGSPASHTEYGGATLKREQGEEPVAETDHSAAELRRLGADCFLYDNVVIHFEDASDRPAQQSHALALFVQMANNLVVKFNRPGNSLDFDYVVNVDRRSTVAQLRKAIVTELNASASAGLEAVMESSDFHLYVNCNRNYEMKCDESTLVSCTGVYASASFTTVQLVPVGSIPLGHSVIALYLLRHPDYTPGVCNSPTAVTLTAEPEASLSVSEAGVCFGQYPSTHSSDPGSTSSFDGMDRGDLEVCVGSDTEREGEDADDGLHVGRATGGRTRPVAGLYYSDSKGAGSGAGLVSWDDWGGGDGHSEGVWEDDIPPLEPACPTPVEESLAQAQAEDDEMARKTGGGMEEGEDDEMARKTGGGMEEGAAYLEQLVPIVFGESSLELVCDDGAVTLGDQCTVDEARVRVLSRLQALGLCGPEVCPGQVRLRDRVSSSFHPERIWRGDSISLREACVHLYDRRVVITQILPLPTTSATATATTSATATATVDVPFSDSEAESVDVPSVETAAPVEDLTLFGEDAVVFIFQPFVRSERRMGPMFELCVGVGMRVCELLNVLGATTGIDPVNLSVLLLSSRYTNDLRVCELELASPSALDKWVGADSTSARQTIRELCWGARDGSVVVFQDITESLRPLTHWEAKAVADEVESKRLMSSDVGDFPASWYGGEDCGENQQGLSVGCYPPNRSDSGSGNASLGVSTVIPKWGSVSSTDAAAAGATVSFKDLPARRAPAEKGIRIKTKQDRDRDRDGEAGVLASSGSASTLTDLAGGDIAPAAAGTTTPAGVTLFDDLDVD